MLGNCDIPSYALARVEQQVACLIDVGGLPFLGSTGEHTGLMHRLNC